MITRATHFQLRTCQLKTNKFKLFLQDHNLEYRSKNGKSLI